MKTKRKYLIIFFIILAALLACGLLTLFLSNNGANCCGKTLFHKSHRQQSKTEEYQSMMPGLWQRDSHVYYRFYADGTGHTWDTDDDLTENEASPFRWQISDGNLILTHQLRMSGFIPRMYHIDVMDGKALQFHDAYSDYNLKRLNR